MPQPFAAIWASRRVSGIGLEPNRITFDGHPSATVLLRKASREVAWEKAERR